MILLLLFALSTLAADKNPRPEMHLIAQEITSMEKYLISETEFGSKENEPKIISSLEKLNQHMVKLNEGIFAHDPTMQVNLSLLSRHLSDADKYFKDGNKSFSRYMIQSSLAMCIACHTRGKSEDFSLPDSDLKGLSSAEQGEYLFATRQFKKGKDVYEDMVSDYPKNKIGPYELRKALLSLAVYYARTKEDPKEGAAYFQKITKKEMPIYIKKEIKAWAEDFKSWSKEKQSKGKASGPQLLAQAKKLLRSDNLSLIGDNDRKFHIRRLRSSALLHKVLESPDKSLIKAEALLYLGQIYHRVNYQLFFRFGEMYLKSCIMDYKNTKVARDCYGALEQMVTEGYSGSSGVSIPEDEEMELIQLKRMAF